MKRTSFSILVVIAVTLSAVIVVDAQNREKFVISAKAGGVNAIAGRAEVRSNHGADWQLLSITDDLKSGDEVKTSSDGRVEMLLNPGSYLRVAEDSEFELTNGSLDNLEVRLTRGTAIIEATGPESALLLINITTPHAKIAIVSSGLYRLSVVPGGGATELIVRKGRVLLDNAQTKVKGGNKVIFTSTNYFVAKLQKADKTQDSVENWSKHRAETLAQANRKISSRDANLFLSNSFDYWNGFSSNPGIWFFNPAFHCFTFLPFLFGWDSPYGNSYSGTWFFDGFHCCGWNPYNRPGLAQRPEEAPSWGHQPSPPPTGAGATGSTGTGTPGGRSGGSPGPTMSPESPIGRGKADTTPDGGRPRMPK
jgi:hypothetical protein